MKIRISQQALLRFGYRAIQLIQERTAKGNGLDGKFASYSTNPLAVPAGIGTKRARKALQGAGRLSYFKKKGKLWMVVHGGYAELKKALYANAKGYTGTPNLAVSGQMLASLQAKTAGENAVVRSFDNAEAARKAYYQHVSGAGKSRVVRRFLGLTNDELKDQTLIDSLAQGAEIEV